MFIYVGIVVSICTLALCEGAVLTVDCACDTPWNRQVLQEVQNETGGALWSAGARFDSSRTVCEWYGVTCNSSDVVSWIVTEDIGMRGSLPISVVDLPALQQLHIRNQPLLSGTLPSEWRRLKNITILWVGGCNISGDLTDWIGHELTTLEELQLWLLKLTGSLPKSYANLTRLKRLSLSNCEFTGTIPDEWSQFKAIELLYVHRNNLTGTIPSWISQLATLQNFAIGFNNISGTIPADINFNKTLKLFYAPSTLLTGTLPSSLVAAPIFFLVVHDSYLSGPLPISSNQSTLLTLRLHGNDFSGTLPQVWSGMTQLTYFNISQQRSDGLCGGIPESWHTVSALMNGTHDLGVSVNRTCPMPTPTFSVSTSLCPCNTRAFRVPVLALYTDTGGPNWGVNYRFDVAKPICSWYGITCVAAEGDGLDGFALLIYYGNDVSMNGTLPAYFGELGPGLEELTIGNQLWLQGTIPDDWKQLVGLRKFELWNNPLMRGTIPSWIVHWSQLARLHMWSMPLFTGTIPSFLGSFRGLTELYLGWLNLSGTLPPELGNLQSLQLLHVAGNELIEGSIPDSFSQLKNLTTLNINYCSIGGAIPSWLPSMVNLVRFTAYQTQITGKLPQHLPPSLVILQLGNTSIYGTLPASWPLTHPELRRGALLQYDAGRPHLCGGVPQSWRDAQGDPNNTFWFNVNETLINESCPLTTESATISRSSSNSDCRVPIDVITSDIVVNCPNGYSPCVSLSSTSVSGTPTVGFRVAASIPYDTIIAFVGAGIQIVLSSTQAGAAGGVSWTSYNGSSTFRGAFGLPLAGGAVSRLLFTPPQSGTTNGTWPIAFTPYVSQALHIGYTTFRCVTDTVTVTFELTATPRALPQIASAVSATSTAAAWGSALSGSGSTASTTARVAAVQKLLLCLDDDPGSGGGLLGLAVGDDRLSSARGAIAGNIIIMLSTTTLIASTGWLLAKFALMRPKKMLNRMHAVSLMFPVLAATLPSSIGGVVRIFMVSDGRDALAWVLAILGVVCWGGLLVGLVWIWLNLRNVIVPTTTPPKSHQAKIKYPLANVLQRHTFWVSATSAVGARDAISAYHVVLREYSVLWYPATEAAVGAISGAATALTAGVSVNACKAVSGALCALYVTHLTLTLWTAPFTTTFGMIYGVLVGFLSAVCVGFQIAFALNNDALWAVSVSTGAAMIVLGLSMTRTLMDLVSLLRGANALRVDAVEERHRVLTDACDVLSLHVMDQLHETDSPTFSHPSPPPSPQSNSTLESSIRLESSLNLSEVEAVFWDADGNARVPSRLNGSFHTSGLLFGASFNHDPFSRAEGH